MSAATPLPPLEKIRLTQFSRGGLLVACAPQAERDVLATFARRGFAGAKKIGSLAAGAANVAVV